MKDVQAGLTGNFNPRPKDGCFGPNLARAFNLRKDISVLPTLPWAGDSKFAITRIKSSAGLGMTNFAPEDALIVSVAIEMVPQGKYQVWADGKELECLDFPQNRVAVACLASAPSLWTDCPVDFYHMYIPHSELAEIAYEHGITRLRAFVPSHGDDLLIARLANLLAQPLMSEAGGGGLRLDYARVILGSHLIQHYSEAKGRLSTASTSKLAPWQKSRSMSMLRDNVSTPIRLAEIADECGLSPSHFARCFKATFGVSVHQSLIRIRVETAQELLAKTRQPIVEIAMQSGFSDQAALTRTFTQVVGTSPARWRKGSCTL